jgi:DNA-binding SARP family transcriptional activator
MDELSIDLLGVCTLRYHGESIREPQSRESLSWRLLKYLAANRGREITAPELAAELWPGQTITDEGNALRVRLSRLRGILSAIGLGDRRSGLVLYAGGRYRLNPDIPVLTDTDEVTSLYRFLCTGDRDPTARYDAGIRALRLFQGEFLACSAPSPWIELQRTQFRRMFAAVAEAARALMEELGRFDDAELLCARALELAPEERELHTAIMATLRRAGLASESVTHYSRLALVLAARGAEPPELLAFL